MMMQVATKLDPEKRRKARRTAWIVGAVALVIYATAIVEVVLHR